MNAQSITNLAYESINEKYSRAKYGEFNVIMDMSNGYINATKLCADGDKRFDNWIRNKINKELVCSFENLLEYEEVLNMDNSFGITRGTYVHPLLIPHIASWVSPLFAYKVSNIVNNFLAREKDDEIRRLTGDKCRLEIMMDEAKKQREYEFAEYKKILQHMTEQNEKTHNKLDETQKTLEVTHSKLDKADNNIEELHNIVEVVNTRLEIVANEIVKPSKRLEVHERFVVMKLNDANSKYTFKVFCAQNQNTYRSKKNILEEYPDAIAFLEVTPSPNSKNFLHNLKDLYGTGKDAKIKIYRNYISLLSETPEDEFCDMVDTVVEDAKNLGNTNSI